MPLAADDQLVDRRAVASTWRRTTCRNRTRTSTPGPRALDQAPASRMRQRSSGWRAACAGGIHAAERPAALVLQRRPRVRPQQVALVEHGVGDAPHASSIVTQPLARAARRPSRPTSRARAPSGNAAAGRRRRVRSRSQARAAGSAGRSSRATPRPAAGTRPRAPTRCRSVCSSPSGARVEHRAAEQQLERHLAALQRVEVRAPRRRRGRTCTAAAARRRVDPVNGGTTTVVRRPQQRAAASCPSPAGGAEQLEQPLAAPRRRTRAGARRSGSACRAAPSGCRGRSARRCAARSAASARPRARRASRRSTAKSSCGMAATTPSR